MKVSLTTRLIESIGLVSQRQLEAATHQAYINGYSDGNDEPPSGDLLSYGYRQTSTGGRRDSQQTWDDLCNAAWTLFESSPPADRGLELKRDHILGRGVDIQTEDDTLNEIIAQFRKVNKFDFRLREYVLQLFLFGAQCLPVSVRQSDGRVKLNYIDPQQIEDVVTHPHNPTELWAVVIKQMEGLPAWAGSNIPRRVFRIVREDAGYTDNRRVITPNYHDRLVTAEQARQEPWESAMLAHYGLTTYTGTCFYFHINAVSNQVFGVSDLKRTIYWLQQLENAIIAVADREQISGYWYNDVEMVGASPDQVRDRAKELKRQPPPRGGNNVHNDREKHEIKQPAASSGSTDVTDMLFDYAWGGLGFPRHWYVQGDSTNRATAQEQGLPVQKTLQSDQDAVKEIIGTIITFVRDQAIIAGYPLDKAAEFEVIMPEIASRNLEAISQALDALTKTLVEAIQNKFISLDTAREVWARLIIELGVEIDMQAEIKKIVPHPDSDIENAPTVEAAGQIAVEKVKLGIPIDGSADIQDEIDAAVDAALAQQSPLPAEEDEEISVNGRQS